MSIMNVSRMFARDSAKTGSSRTEPAPGFSDLKSQLVYVIYYTSSTPEHVFVDFVVY